MKQIFFCIITLLAGMSSVSAQSEMPADTVRSASVRDEMSPEGMSPSEKELLPDVKNYDGFLLDMGLMNLSAPTLPKFTLEIPDASKDYSRIFRLNPNMTYSQGLSNIFSLSNSRYFSSNPFGLTGFRGSADNLQMISIKNHQTKTIRTHFRNRYLETKAVSLQRIDSNTTPTPPSILNRFKQTPYLTFFTLPSIIKLPCACTQMLANNRNTAFIAVLQFIVLY